MMEIDWLAEQMERQDISMIVQQDIHDITHFLLTHQNQGGNNNSEKIQRSLTRYQENVW